MGLLDDFVHRYESGERDATIVLLHGTGGDENDLIPLARQVAPGTGILSPRGRVLEGEMPRFFKRLAAGVFDQEDLAFRTDELAGFITEASDHYGFDLTKTIALGFSNGANIAASLLLRHPRVVAGAVLMHAMVPYEPDLLPDLEGIPVLITAGRSDQMIPPESAQRLFDVLQRSGAAVEIHWSLGGHQPDLHEIERVAGWIGENG